MSTYLVVRAHGLNTRLLPPQFYESIPTLKTLKDILNLLTPTEYSKYIEKKEMVTVEDLYRAYVKVFSDRLNLITRIPLSRTLVEFLQIIYRRYEIENIIKVLLGIKSKKEFSEIETFLIPNLMSKVDLLELYQTKTIERAIEYLRSKGFKISEKAYELYNKYDSLLPIEADLKKEYLGQLIEYAKKLGKKNEKFIRMLVGIEVDIENIFISVSPLLYSYSEELTKFLLIPYTAKVSYSTFLKIVSTKIPREVLDALSVYRDIVIPLLDKKELKARLNGLKILAEFLNSYKIQSSMLLSYLLYLVKKMETEYKILIYLTYSTHYGIESELSVNMIIK